MYVLKKYSRYKFRGFNKNIMKVFLFSNNVFIHPQQSFYAAAHLRCSLGLASLEHIEHSKFYN